MVISGRRVSKYSNITSVGLWTWLQLNFWYSCSPMLKLSARCFQHLLDPYLYSLSRHREIPSRRSRQPKMDSGNRSAVHFKKYMLHYFTSYRKVPIVATLVTFGVSLFPGTKNQLEHRWFTELLHGWISRCRENRILLWFRGGKLHLVLLVYDKKCI